MRGKTGVTSSLVKARHFLFDRFEQQVVFLTVRFCAFAVVFLFSSVDSVPLENLAAPLSHRVFHDEGFVFLLAVSRDEIFESLERYVLTTCF